MKPLADGYHPLAPGKLATLVTYLEMSAPPERKGAPLPRGYEIREQTRWDVDAFKRLYCEIGWEWLWSSRLLIDEKELDRRLHRKGMRSFVPEKDGRPMGVLETDFGIPENVEITFFGLVPAAVGSGLGRALMDFAIDVAFAQGKARRLWLHTCHFDSPKALPFYQKMGFKPYARAVEVFDDARLIGRLDKSAGPHVPVIENARLPDQMV